jgi:hypothetical protein
MKTPRKQSNPEQADVVGGVRRRQFMATVAGTAATLGLSGSAASAGAAPLESLTDRDPMANWTVEQFRHMLGDAFFVHASDGQRHALRLAEAEPGLASAGRGRAPFSLVFHGSPQGPTQQDSYQLSHPTLGTFTLLLVPVDRQQSATRLQAVFA